MWSKFSFIPVPSKQVLIIKAVVTLLATPKKIKFSSCDLTFSEFSGVTDSGYVNMEQRSRRLNCAVLILNKQDIRALTHPSSQVLGGFMLPEKDALPIIMIILNRLLE